MIAENRPMDGFLYTFGDGGGIIVRTRHGERRDIEEPAVEV